MQLIKTSSGNRKNSLVKRNRTDALSDQFEEFLSAASLKVCPSTTSLDLAYLCYAFACSQDSNRPVNPQYVGGSASLNLRMLWLLYYSQYCGKLEAPALTPSVAVAAAPVVTASIFSNFLTPKIARPISTASLTSSTSATTTASKASGEALLVGNTEARLALQQWLEEWAGKRRTPKKPKKAAKAKGSKRGRRDEDYSSEDDAWDSENEEEGLPNVLMLLGSSGTNKTATVYHYAKLLGYNVMEVNTSMVRSRSNIQKMFSEGVQSQSMASSMDFSNQDGDDDDVRAPGKKNTSSKSFLSNSGVKSKDNAKSSGVDASKKSLNLILFDEMDVVFEEFDTHFHSSIVALSKVSKCPIVLTSETLCPAFIHTCKPKLVRMYRPNAVDVASHLVAKFQGSTSMNKQFETQLMSKAILPLLCDGDSRACQNTLNTVNVATLTVKPATAASSAVVVDLCEASPTSSKVVEVVDLTASSPTVSEKKCAVTSATARTEDSSDVIPPLFGTFLADQLNVDFALFDHLGSVLTSDIQQPSSEPAVPVCESVNAVAQRLIQETDSSCAVVVPVVSTVEPRTMLSCDNTVVRVFGKHFLQRAGANKESWMSAEVLLNETMLKEGVIVSDTVIAAVIPAKLFAAGVYSVVVRLKDCNTSSGVRSNICGSAGGWILINDRVFKTMKVAVANPYNNNKGRKSTKPIAKTMDLFVFGSAPSATPAAVSSSTASPRAASGKRLQRSADKVSPSKRARKEDCDEDASVNTEATEDDIREEESRDKAPAGKLPVRRRLQVCDDDDEDEGDVEVKDVEEVRSVRSAGLTESTVDENTVVSSEIVKDASVALHDLMVGLLRDLMAPSLSDFNSYFLNASLSEKEVSASVMDLATIENMLLDKLYVKNATFQDVVESEFPDLDAFIADVRSLWSNSLKECGANSVHSLHACMLSEMFEKLLKQRIDVLSADSAKSFNAVAAESVEAPLTVASGDNACSLFLYNIPVGQIDEFRVFTDHEMHSSWMDDGRFKDLSIVLTSAATGVAVEDASETIEPEVPAAEVSLDEFRTTQEKLLSMLNESHDKRVKACSAVSGSMKVDYGMEYSNEDSPMVFVPYAAGRRSTATNGTDDVQLACLDSLMDLSESLDLMSSMDILSSRAVNYCNYSDAYIAPAANATPLSSAAANASITEVNNDFDSMYERFALVGGEEAYDHIPDEIMVNFCNSSNSSELSECNFATFQRSGVALSDISSIVRSGALNLNKSRIAAQLTSSDKSERYSSSYRYHLNSYKFTPAASTSETAIVKVCILSI